MEKLYVEEGVSTRKVTDVTEALCAARRSPEACSRGWPATSRRGASGVEEPAAHREGLSLPVLVDARYEKVRVGARVVSQGVLVVSAVCEDGFREILTVEVADTESARRPTRIRSAL
jgi:putative transposase